MSDINSSLPVRTQTNGDVAVKVCDGTTPSQLLAVTSAGHVLANMSDGAGTALTSTLVSSKQALDVNVVASTPPGVADKSTFTYGTSLEQPIGGVFQDTSPTVTAGQSGAVRMTANRGLHMNLRDSSGNELLGQKAMAASVPVVIASDQSNINVVVATALPAGTNTIGSVKLTDGTSTAVLKAASTAAAAADPSVVVALSPNSPLPAGSSTIGAVNQGTAAVTANAWPIKVTDGTNSAAVKAASTAALAADPSLVVALSPNSPVPTGTNTIGSVKLTDGTNVGTIKAASTAAVVGDTSLVVALSPNSPIPAGTANIGKVSIQDSTGAAISPTNPLPVYVQDSVGTEVNDYKTATVAGAGSDNHDYTVTALKILDLAQIWCSASGKAKFTVTVETGVASGTFNTVFVAFNSTANPNVKISLSDFIRVAAGVRVRVIATNLDILTQDLYTTICGHEL